MSKIIVSYYKVQETAINKILGFWDGFIQELQACGNDVFVINTAYFNSYESNETFNRGADQVILSEAKKFNPDLIIAFNHRVPKSILDNIDVPVIIWDGDELTYFCDLDYIRKNLSRYRIFSIVEGWRQDYLDFGFRKDQIHLIPAATAIQKMAIPQPVNVSFVGLRHYHNNRYNYMISRRIFSNRFYNIVREFLCTQDYDYLKLFKNEFEKTNPDFRMTLRDLYPLFDYRWLDLANMLDLGLCIAGHETRWESATEYMPQLAAAYSNQQVWTLEENARFLNASKVSLSPISPQARGSGYPWRVFDIMASNACLLVSQSSDLKRQLAGHVDVPMYGTPWEARELCIRLLRDNAWRKDLVAASQEYVDTNARWIHRFREMESILNMKFAAESSQGQVYNAILDNQTVQKLWEKQLKKKKIIRNAKNKLKTMMNLPKMINKIGKNFRNHAHDQN